MKKIFIISGYVVLAVLAILYLSFLFILPNKIDLNVYKSDIQKLVKENTDLSIDFDRVEVITSPLLEAGIKTKNITVKLPDNSTLFSAESFKGKVFLPSLLWLSVKVSCAEIEAPKLNVEIINSEKYKVAKVFEDLVNKKRAQKREALQPEESQNELPFDPSKIKLYIPALKLNNYNAVIDDVKDAHKLTLQGKQIKVGYYNGKTAKLKADAEFLSDSDKNITANIDIDSFIPNVTPAEKEKEDADAVFEFPFVNPVTVYRDYSLKSNVNSKIKIRKNKHTDKIWAKGNVDITDTTVTLSGLELPPSYLKLNAKGHVFDIDTNIYATDKEFLNLKGLISNEKRPYVDLAFKSTQVHIANLLKITQAYLDTIHVRNDIAQMSANGYLFANFKFKTDFEELISDGKFIIRDGNIYDNNLGLLFNDINANVILDNNTLSVKDTHVLINNKPLKISGQIDSDSVANLDINADKIPLAGLYKAFAPREIKNSYNLNSGNLTLNANIKGEIKDTSSILKTELENFDFSDRAGKFVITNKLARFGLANYSGTRKGRFKNEDFKFILPATKSEISDKVITADFDNSSIKLNDSFIKFNKNSLIKFNGEVKDYISKPTVTIIADGALKDSDIKILAGDAISPYLESSGQIPIKLNFESKKNKSKTVLQLQSDSNSYITPIKLDDLYGQKVLFQLLAEQNGDNIKVYKSGFYIRRPNAEFRDKLSWNLINSTEILGIRAMISNMKTKPFINLFKISPKKDLKGSICILPQSEFIFSGGVNAFGDMKSPKIAGKFNVKSIKIPEFMTTIRDIAINIRNQDIRINIFDILANGSDFNIDAATTFAHIAKTRIDNINIFSKLINIDKLLKVTESITALLPKSNNTSSVQAAESKDIPLSIVRGNIDLKKITTGNIVVNNTTGRISLDKNILYVNQLRTQPLGGNVNGDVNVNLLNQEIKAKLTGKDFDVAKVLLDVMNMKDTLSGKMNFITDLSFQGTSVEEQMKSMKGFVDFNIVDGQLGPFGKFENFLMAENIRENAFFSSAIGSVITNIVTFDTTRYNNLFGHLTFDNGFAQVAPIKTQGNVMSLYIAGKVGLLDNSADLILRGKLGSAFSDSLGPLANINPVNLIKNTPGLNIVAAKSFAIFCEAVSEEEMNALPPLGKGKSDDYATKFQIKLKGDTRKPLKMIKSFKWLALNSEIESAKNFVDSMPVPEPGEENMTVEELVKLREEQAAEAAAQKPKEKESVFKKVKNKIKKKSEVNE